MTSMGLPKRVAMKPAVIPACLFWQVYAMSWACAACRMRAWNNHPPCLDRDLKDNAAQQQQQQQQQQQDEPAGRASMYRHSNSQCAP